MCYFSFYFIFIYKNCIIILGVIMKNIRLEKVLSFIDKTDCLADVGCDHGYLAIMAIEKGVSFVQLIDNKKGPLDSAKINLKHYQVNYFYCPNYLKKYYYLQHLKYLPRQALSEHL